MFLFRSLTNHKTKPKQTVFTVTVTWVLSLRSVGKPGDQGLCIQPTIGNLLCGVVNKSPFGSVYFCKADLSP